MRDASCQRTETMRGMSSNVAQKGRPGFSGVIRLHQPAPRTRVAGCGRGPAGNYPLSTTQICAQFAPRLSKGAHSGRIPSMFLAV